MRRPRFCSVAGAALLATMGTSCTHDVDAPPTDDLTKAVAVVDPGASSGPIRSDDLLIVGRAKLSDRLVERIGRIEVGGEAGVVATERFSLGQVSVEGTVVDVAAVDPAGFRRFTGEDAGDQALWERVAQGDVAVAGPFRRRLPLDDEGGLYLGTGEDRHQVRVGAFAAHQVGTIDGIVNMPQGVELALPTDNALVVSTGISSPRAVRNRIARFAPRLSISALDIVAETGIDIGTRQNVNIVGTLEDAVGSYHYSPIGGGRVAPDPAWVRSHIVTEAVPILGQVTCNRFLMPQLRSALGEIQSAGLADEIHPDEFAGCYYPRFIAGTTTLSNHAFGLALDLNVPGNQRGTTGQIDRAVVAVFKRWGFAWGGDWSYTDPMHFELARIVAPD